MDLKQLICVCRCLQCMPLVFEYQYEIIKKSSSPSTNNPVPLILVSHIGGQLLLCWAVICSCQTTFKPPFLIAKSTIKHHFRGRSGKASTVPKSHGSVVPRVTGSSPTPSMATSGMAAVTLAAGLLGVQVCAGPVAERLGNRFPVWKGLQRKFQDGSKSNMGGSAVGFFPGAKERGSSWCITLIELGSLAEGAHIGSLDLFINCRAASWANPIVIW